MASIHSMPNMRDSNRIFVIGHVNPDTDAIASAMGYAWLLQERGWSQRSSGPVRGDQQANCLGSARIEPGTSLTFQ